MHVMVRLDNGRVLCLLLTLVLDHPVEVKLPANIAQGLWAGCPPSSANDTDDMVKVYKWPLVHRRHCSKSRGSKDSQCQAGAPPAALLSHACCQVHHNVKSLVRLSWLALCTIQLSRLAVHERMHTLVVIMYCNDTLDQACQLHDRSSLLSVMPANSLPD